MKRLAAAGTFALLAGGASLLLLASIFYSCRGGGQPHDMGTSATDHAPSNVPDSPPPQVMGSETRAPNTAHRIELGGPSPRSL